MNKPDIRRECFYCSDSQIYGRIEEISVGARYPGEIINFPMGVDYECICHRHNAFIEDIKICVEWGV